VGSRAGTACTSSRKLVYTYNWLGERIQTVTSDRDVTTGKHILTAEFQKTSDDEQTKSATGTLTLYIDDEPVGKVEIVTQPGTFALGATGCASGVTARHPCRRTTRLRSHSRGARSTGSSWT
jgi:hypothetical protein